MTNEGNVTYENVVITDDLTGASKTVAELAVGASETLETSYVVTEEDILAGSVKNTATAEADPVEPEEGDPQTPKGEDSTETGDEDDPDGPTPPVEEKDPHLTINKTTTSTPANGETYAVNEEIAYKITVMNDGNVTISDITVKDDLTGEEWTIASLEPGEFESFETSYTVTEADVAAGGVTNVATATGKDPEGDEPTVDPGKKEDPTEPMNAHLTVEKTTTSTAPAEGYKEGDVINYSVTVTNDGNVTITNIQVKDNLTGGSWTIDSLAVGASESFTTSYTVTEADQIRGYVLNVATAEGTDPNGDPAKVDPGTKEDPAKTPEYTLTIKYRYYDGRTAASDYTATVPYNQTYRVESPVIGGYVSSPSVVAGTMPARDVTRTVIYVTSEEGESVDEPIIFPLYFLIDEYGTPLGLGNLNINLGEGIE